MDSLAAMRIFLRVAELGSFTRAADQLGLPKGNASAAVQRLESDLGTRLLHRTTRRVEMTQDGSAFFERCRDVLGEVDALQGMFREGAALQGRLRVDMPVAMARNHVLPRLPEFLDAHPQVEMELSCTDRRVDLVREGFDCVLRIGPLGDANLHARPLGSLRMVNCASPGYLKAFGTPRRLTDLSRHRLVHYASSLGGRPAGWEWVEDGRPATVPMLGVLTVNNTDAYQAACLAGLGLIQAPAIGVRPHLESGALVEVLPRHRPESMPVSLVYASRRQLPARVLAFMDWLAQVLAPELEQLHAGRSFADGR
jgi:DNA-binding transcriptional LysR family regulator